MKKKATVSATAGAYAGAYAPGINMAIVKTAIYNTDIRDRVISAVFNFKN